MKLCTLISRLQEQNTYLEEFPHNIPGQENTPLTINKIMDIIDHSVYAQWKNKMIEQGFNYTDSAIKARVYNLELKKD